MLDLLDAAIWFDEMVELLTVLATTGVRVGEALGAYWSDLDLEAGVWEVQRTTTVNAAGVAVIGGRTKTGEGRRVALHDAAVAAFTAQRARAAAARLAAGPLWSDHDLVFPSELGTVWDSRNARKRLRPITAAALFPGSFHALRHAFATTAVAVLPSDAAVAKVMGHRRKATTVDLYGHLRDVDFRSVTDAVAADLAAARPDPTLGVTLGVKSAEAVRNPKHRPQVRGLDSAPGGTRTPNQPGRNRSLYPLSYGRGRRGPHGPPAHCAASAGRAVTGGRDVTSGARPCRG